MLLTILLQDKTPSVISLNPLLAKSFNLFDLLLLEKMSER